MACPYGKLSANAKPEEEPAVPETDDVQLNDERETVGLVNGLTRSMSAPSSAASAIGAEPEPPTGCCGCCDGSPRCVRFCSIMRQVKPALVLGVFIALESIATSIVSPVAPYDLDAKFGNKRSARIVSWGDAARSVVGMLFAPFMGALLDAIGRRPFFVANAVLTVLPALVLWRWPGAPLAYVCLNQLRKTLSSAYELAYITDHYHTPGSRGLVFALTNGVGVLAAMSVFGMMNWSVAQLMLAAVIVAGVRIPYALLLVPESLKPAQKQPLNCQAMRQAPAVGWRIMRSSRALMATLAVSGGLTMATASTDIWQYYFIHRIPEWPKEENMSYAIELMMMFPLGTVVLYPLLSRALNAVFLPSGRRCCAAEEATPSERRTAGDRAAAGLCVFGYLTCLGMLAAVGLATKPWMVFWLVAPLMGGVCASIPAVIGLYASCGPSGDRARQGARMAWLQAVMDAVSAIGPIAVGQLYSALKDSLAWVPFAILGGLCLPLLVVAAVWLPRWVAADRRQQAEEAALASPPVSTHTSTASAAAAAGCPHFAADAASVAVVSDELPQVTVEDVRRHIGGSSASLDGVWVSFRGGVYDVTPFLTTGHAARCCGADTVAVIVAAAGRDLTSFFDAEHRRHQQPDVQALLETYRVGTLAPAAAAEMAAHWAFEPDTSE